MTENQQQMVIDGLNTAMDYVPRLTVGLEKVVELMREGQDAEAKTLFYEASEGLEWYTTVLAGLKVLYPDILEKELNGELLINSINGLLEQYIQLVDALGKDDEVLFADILEYEIVPKLTDWCSMIPQLLAIVGAN